MPLFDNKNTCVVCGILYDKPLCKAHRKYYRFVKEYNFYALKPKRSISKPQTKLFKIIRGLFHELTFQEVIFQWNLYRRYDIVVPGLKMVAEYDGAQHVKFNKLFHKTKERFEEMKLQEIIKENIARNYGYTVIRFSHIENINDKEYVLKKIKLKTFEAKTQKSVSKK